MGTLTKLQSSLPAPVFRLVKWPYQKASDAYLAVGARYRPGEFGRCAVCGQLGRWVYQRLAFPQLEARWALPPQLFEALSRKESTHCPHCWTTLRGRRIASALLEHYPVGDGKTSARTLADWVQQPEIRALRVAEINRIDGVHGMLGRLPHHAFSDYSPGAAPGEVVGDIRSEDLTQLTYPDASFDLVLTSETLEHVPDLDAALREIHRILVPGGRHVFTIPLMPGVPKTYRRAVVRSDGAIEHFAAPISHPGGDSGALVFTEFGADVPDILKDAGFDCELMFGPISEQDVALVFVCRKKVA